MAVISKGIKLSYKAGEASDYIDLVNLQEIPELGGSTDSIEVTTLSDGAHIYTDGIKNYGDSLSFKFLYSTEQFTTLSSVTGANWKVSLPDGTACTFAGTSSVKLDGVGVNAALTYTLTIRPSSAMIWADKA